MTMALGKLPDAVDEGTDDGGESIFAEINITPLTDVFLVMVIIFMVSALAVQVEARREKKKITQEVQQSEIEKRSGINVNLPSGQAQEIDPSKVSLVLVVPINGEITVTKADKSVRKQNFLQVWKYRDDKWQMVLGVFNDIPKQ